LQEKANSGNVADEQLAAAQAALKENNLAAALDLFDQVLAADPKNVVAQSGYAEVWRRMQLADTYNTAVTTLDAGHFEQALSILTEIEETAPNYRDARQLIQQAQNMLRVRQLYLEAESAYTAQQWETAVQTYESLRKIDGVYASEVVVPHLAEAYRRLGQQIVARRPDQGADLDLARSYFDHALRIQPGEALAQQEADLLAQYNAAIAAYTAGDGPGMVALLEPLYAEHPAYLGGFMAEQLYAAYLQLGDEAAVDDTAQASAWYDKAAGLQTVDASEAKLRSEALSTPPTPTATPEPVAQAPVYVPAPPAPPTPTATPSGLEAYQGWIAFRTGRDGDTVIYLMQPDGGQQQRAPADAAARLDQLYSQQQWAIDGAQVYVANAPMRNDTNVYLARNGPPDSGGATTRAEVMLTDFPGLEYDPVWSPDGKTIAFVANHTYNDEIFTLVVDGGAPVQLTHNEWEWDKRPSWSPDGSQIVFYSNRSGQRQIWIMNADGTNQRNISNSSAEDWDPVWIR
jgi:TolB protein